MINYKKNSTYSFIYNLIELIKGKLLIFLLLFQVHLSFSQTTDVTPNFGIQLIDEEFELPTKYNYVTNVHLQVLRGDKSRSFYNENNEREFNKYFKYAKKKNVTWDKKAGAETKYQTVIPPLKPNRFYRLEVSYYTSESIVAMFLMMHDEKNTNWYSTKKEWMKLLNRISAKNFTEIDGKKQNFPITYDPTIIELKSFKNRIKDLDLTFLKVKEEDYIKGIDDAKEIQKKKEELKSKKENIIQELDKAAKLEFEVLNFIENQNKYTKKDLVKFCDTISSKPKLVQDDILLFSSILVDSPDYINIFSFYEKYLLGPLNDQSIDKGKLKNFIELAITKEKLSYADTALLPNYLFPFEENVLKRTVPVSTYPKSFESSFKLSLVPDFGYVAYLSENSNTPQGGNIFLGVNVSLSPSNKNVPLKISRLSLKQRLAIHTGVTIGSVAEDSVRDNFFASYSLLMGGSYKVFTQGTRINFGGLLYNKIDAINGNKSVAIQPYIGLSIDIEIRQWLQKVFPKLKI